MIVVEDLPRVIRTLALWSALGAFSACSSGTSSKDGGGQTGGNGSGGASASGGNSGGGSTGSGGSGANECSPACDSGSLCCQEPVHGATDGPNTHWVCVATTSTICPAQP
jgi:hypothetical protein